ncbi:MAG: AlkZ family DNA glycosylase [Candidatus Sericytochromatia bacterium]|nr:AlkZ family DNA glycosylase [Candidatus Sericytochromatia bacterium]
MPSWARELRLHNLGLTTSAQFETPLNLLTGLGALQAQEYENSLWALALRLRSKQSLNPSSKLAQDRRRALNQAIAKGEIVRSWPMRGTLHWVPGSDLSWMLALMTPRILAASAGRLRQLEITPDVLTQTGECLRELLAENAWLSRPEILAAFEKRGIATHSQRGYHLLGYHAQTGLICQGPPLGKQPSFALLEAFCPTQTQLSSEAALAEIARRYFSGHGPATVQDLARWTGLSLTQARQGLSAIKNELTSETWADNSHWFYAPSAKMRPVASPQACLLPAFDEYLIGYQDRDSVLDPQFADLVIPGKNGVFHPVFLLDGLVRGIWKRQIKRKNVQIQLFPFKKLADSESQALIRAVEDYAAYLNQPFELGFQSESLE